MLLRAPPVNQSQGEANIAIGLSFAYGCLQCSFNLTWSRAFKRLSILMAKSLLIRLAFRYQESGEIEKKRRESLKSRLLQLQLQLLIHVLELVLAMACWRCAWAGSGARAGYSVGRAVSLKISAGVGLVLGEWAIKMP